MSECTLKNENGDALLRMLKSLGVPEQPASMEDAMKRIAELEKALKCFTKAFNGAVVHAESSSDNRWERIPKEYFNELHVADYVARSVLMGKGGAK